MLNKLRGIRSQGDSIRDILYYWLPEMLSTTMLISLSGCDWLTLLPSSLNLLQRLGGGLTHILILIL